MGLRKLLWCWRVHVGPSESSYERTVRTGGSFDARIPLETRSCPESTDLQVMTTLALSSKWDLAVAFLSEIFQDAGFSHGAWAAACCDNFPGTRALSPAHRIEQEPHGHHCIPCLRRSESLPQGRK